MNARVWISLFNLVAIVAAFAVLFELPQYSGYAFYGLLGWILVSFLLIYAFRVGRLNPATGAQAGGTGAPSGSTGARSAALPSSSGTSPSGPIDFCIYCGSSLPVGTAVCPACGHVVRAV